MRSKPDVNRTKSGLSWDKSRKENRSKLGLNKDTTRSRKTRDLNQDKTRTLSRLNQETGLDLSGNQTLKPGLSQGKKKGTNRFKVRLNQV